MGRYCDKIAVVPEEHKCTLFSMTPNIGGAAPKKRGRSPNSSTDHEARRIMFDIAEGYDRLAERAAERVAGRSRRLCNSRRNQLEGDAIRCNRDADQRTSAGPARNGSTGAREEIIEPDLPIVDPHHHLVDRPETGRYLLPDLLADIGSGHNITATVYLEWLSMYRADGPAEIAPGRRDRVRQRRRGDERQRRLRQDARLRRHRRLCRSDARRARSRRCWRR